MTKVTNQNFPVRELNNAQQGGWLAHKKISPLKGTFYGLSVAFGALLILGAGIGLASIGGHQHWWSAGTTLSNLNQIGAFSMAVGGGTLGILLILCGAIGLYKSRNSLTKESSNQDQTKSSTEPNKNEIKYEFSEEQLNKILQPGQHTYVLVLGTDGEYAVFCKSEEGKIQKLDGTFSFTDLDPKRGLVEGFVQTSELT